VSRVERRVLHNGLTVLAERRGLGNVVFAGIVYGVGSRDERPGITGISHLLEHMMFKGTKRFAKGEVAALVERNGGELNAFTSEDVTMYYEVFSADRWQLGLEIEAERMVNLEIDPQELEAERQVILEERTMYLDMPAVEVSEELIAATFRESPYRVPIIGWESDIRSITRDDLLEHYRRFYAPASAALVVVGDVDPEDVFRTAEHHFGGIPGGPPPERRALKEPPLARTTRIELSRRTTLPQLHVLFRAPEIRTRDSEALYLLASILSGAKTSRLDLALVETNRAGDVSVQYHPKADPSTLVVAVEGQPDVPLDEIEGILRGEIDRLRTEAVGADELERALNQVEAHHVFALQSPSNRGFALGWHEAHGDFRYTDDVVRRLRELGPEDLQAAAREWLDPARSGWARLVPC
jgi:zinc protease